MICRLLLQVWDNEELTQQDAVGGIVCNLNALYSGYSNRRTINKIWLPLNHPNKDTAVRISHARFTYIREISWFLSKYYREGISSYTQVNKRINSIHINSRYWKESTQCESFLAYSRQKAIIQTRYLV